MKISQEEKRLVMERRKAVACTETGFELKKDHLDKYKWLEAVMGGYRWIIIKKAITPEVLLAPAESVFDPEVHYRFNPSGYEKYNVGKMLSSPKPFIRMGAYPTFAYAKKKVFQTISKMKTGDTTILENLYKTYLHQTRKI